MTYPTQEERIDRTIGINKQELIKELEKKIEDSEKSLSDIPTDCEIAENQGYIIGMIEVIKMLEGV